METSINITRDDLLNDLTTNPNPAQNPADEVGEQKPRRKRGGRTVLKPKKVKVEEGKLYAFKVMKRMGNGELHSGSVPVGSKLYKIYQEGHKTAVSEDMFNAGYGILVFKTLDQAYNWDGQNPGTKEIWKVEVGELRPPNECRLSYSVLGSIFPKDKMSKTSYRMVLNLLKKRCVNRGWPTGAMSADYVIPVEKVY